MLHRNVEIQDQKIGRTRILDMCLPFSLSNFRSSSSIDSKFSSVTFLSGKVGTRMVVCNLFCVVSEVLSRLFGVMVWEWWWTFCNFVYETARSTLILWWNRCSASQSSNAITKYLLQYYILSLHKYLCTKTWKANPRYSKMMSLHSFAQLFMRAEISTATWLVTCELFFLSWYTS